MDDLHMPTTFLRDLAECVAQARRAQDRREPAPPGSSEGHPFLPIVEADRLYFRVITRAGSRPEVPDGVADALAGTFGEVWRRLPRPDRQRLLAYWREQRGWDPTFGPREGPRPFSEVIHPSEVSAEGVDQFGHHLSFPAALIMRRPRAVALSVGRALAGAYRLATGAHWSVVLRLVAGPLERWGVLLAEAAAEAHGSRRHRLGAAILQ